MTLTLRDVLVTTSKTSARWDQYRPERIGTVAGVTFCEHPTRGDESPLVVKQDGRWVITEFWEVPDIHELCEVV